jgi:hypothetical protein
VKILVSFADDFSRMRRSGFLGLKYATSPATIGRDWNVPPNVGILSTTISVLETTETTLKISLSP